MSNASKDASGRARTIKKIREAERRFTEAEFRVFNYFWADSWQRIDEHIHFETLEYLEKRRLREPPTKAELREIGLTLDRLVNKRWLEVAYTKAGRIFSPTKEGLVLLIDEHPKWRRWVARWETLTKEARTLLLWVGSFVAGTFGVVGFALAHILK